MRVPYPNCVKVSNKQYFIVLARLDHGLPTHCGVEWVGGL